MKTSKIFKFIAAVFLVFGFCQNSSAQEFNPKDLIGSWTFKEGPSFARISPEQKMILDEKPQMRDEIFANYSNRVMAFAADGSFSQINGKGQRMDGTWQLNGSALIIVDRAGNQWIQDLIRLDRNQLILDQRTTDKGEPIIPQLHFFKS